MKLLKELNEMSQEYALYFDYTGAGRGPEAVAGPFSSKQEAVEYAEEHGHNLVGSGSEYFVDVHPLNVETFETINEMTDQETRRSGEYVSYTAKDLADWINNIGEGDFVDPSDITPAMIKRVVQGINALDPSENMEHFEERRFDVVAPIVKQLGRDW